VNTPLSYALSGMLIVMLMTCWGWDTWTKKHGDPRTASAIFKTLVNYPVGLIPLSAAVHAVGWGWYAISVLALTGEFPLR